MRRKKLSPSAWEKRLFALVLFFAVSLGAYFSDQMQEVHLPAQTQPVEIYANQTQDDLTRTFATAIDSAKESVLLAVYSLTDATIIHALNAKSHSGVSTTVICDAKASPYVDKKLSKKIQVTRRFAQGLMHLKILVVDSRLIWIGSANMTGESLRVHGNLVLGLENQELAACIQKRLLAMDVESKMQGERFCTAPIGDNRVELWFLPDNPEALQKIVDLLRTAKKTIRIAMFTWTRADLAFEVIRAHERGVDVEVVIDYNSGRGASARIVSLLLDHKVPVTLSQGPGLLHHKFAYIDSRVLINGSANWTKSAFSSNDDCFIVLEGLTKEQIAFLNNLWTVISHESTTPD